MTGRFEPYWNYKMPTRKKSQITDLGALLKGLNEAGIEYIVVGGLAAVIQGAPVTTFDCKYTKRHCVL